MSQKKHYYGFKIDYLKTVIEVLCSWTSVEGEVKRNQYCEDHKSRYVKEKPMIEISTAQKFD